MTVDINKAQASLVNDELVEIREVWMYTYRIYFEQDSDDSDKSYMVGVKYVMKPSDNHGLTETKILDEIVLPDEVPSRMKEDLIEFIKEHAAINGITVKKEEESDEY